MSIITRIKNLYFGTNYPSEKIKFIKTSDPDMVIEDCLTMISVDEDRSYSIIENEKCYLKCFDEETNEWVFVPVKSNSDIEHRFVDISHLEAVS